MKLNFTGKNIEVTDALRDVTVEMAKTTNIVIKATLPLPFINVLKKSVTVTTKTNQML